MMKCEERQCTLQLYMAESSESIRDLYNVAYSLPLSAEMIQNAITKKLQYLFGEHLLELTVGDFYELGIARGGIMRSYMAKPCSEKLTIEKKVQWFPETSFKIYDVSKHKIFKAINFVQQFDFAQVAESTIAFLIAYLEDKTTREED